MGLLSPTQKGDRGGEVAGLTRWGLERPDVTGLREPDKGLGAGGRQTGRTSLSRSSTKEQKKPGVKGPESISASLQEKAAQRDLYGWTKTLQKEEPQTLPGGARERRFWDASPGEPLWRRRPG